MKLFNTPFFVHKVNPSRIWKMPADENKVYLTFDDGPTENITCWILDKLKEYNALASFFCVGDNLVKFPGTKMAMLAAGHTVANHSYNHINGFKTTVNEYVENVEKCEPLTQNLLFRPPYGKIKPAQTTALKQKGYKIIMWSVLTYDFLPGLDKNKSFKKITEHTKPGSIIVFHDNQKSEANMKYLLPRTLDWISEKGLGFGAL